MAQVDPKILFVNNAFSGSEYEYTIPSGSTSVILKANGGDLTLAHETGGSAVWTLKDGETWGLNQRTPHGIVLYINGAAGTLEITEVYGLAN